MPASFPTALLSPREMAEADRLAATTMPSMALMERAGAAVASAASTLLRKNGTRRVLILCGPGNNGGDGYVAARRLQNDGCIVTLASSVDRAALKGDAAVAASRWAEDVHSLCPASLTSQDLVIDALFGAGLARAIDGAAKTIVECANAWRRETGRAILAVDVPSGIDGATGRATGVAIEASSTVTFFRLKPGHVLMPGRSHCGSLTLADIGIERWVLDTIAPKTSLNSLDLWRSRLPEPSLTGHKYARGHAVVVSGPMSQTGAARLAARGALRIGAGLVTIATPSEALPIHAAALTAVMTRVADDPGALADLLVDSRKNAVCIGPGLGTGPDTCALVQAVLAPRTEDSAPRSVVLDADALTAFAQRPRDLFDAIAASGHHVVLTPHDGEFVKLFGSVLDIRTGKLERASAASAMSAATLVLKGPDTVVAHPDGRASIALSDSPWLATAGSGDVLAGMITGLLAQEMPPYEAASAAVWMHAEAGRRIGPGLISEDLPDALPGVMRDLFAPHQG